MDFKVGDRVKTKAGVSRYSKREFTITELKINGFDKYASLIDGKRDRHAYYLKDLEHANKWKKICI